MENTVCVFNFSKSECRGRKRRNLPHMSCDTHVREIYGLEMEYTVLETPMTYEFVGGFWKPVEGTTFKKNCVIIPERTFFDKWFHSGAMDDEDSKYTMNTHIQEFMRQVAMRKDYQVNHRYMIEVIRNLSEGGRNVNLGPYEAQDRLMNKAISLIASKMTLTETRIEKEPFWSYASTFTLVVEDQDTADQEKMSTLMRYMLSKCHFSLHYLDKDQVDPIVHNCKYVKSVGLVATEDISHPMPLIIFGFDTTRGEFLDEVINSVPKTILPRRVTLNDIPENYSRKSYMRGGLSAECFFG